MFSNLTPCQFEEFCYHLLQSHMLRNINWRKGANGDASPADSGRDIECEYHRYDNILNRIIIEKWFIECKHCKQSVSPNQIDSALSWANAERPDRLIIMSSGFLSNRCKDHLKTAINNNKYSYKIEIWEQNEIERMARKYPYILKKFNIEVKDEIVNYLNEYHINYIKRQPMVLMNLFEDALACFPTREKEMFFEIMSVFFLKFEDCKDNNLNYENVIIKNLDELSKNYSFNFINVFINVACNLLLHNADPFKIDEIIDRQESYKLFLAEKYGNDVANNLIIHGNNYQLDKDAMSTIYNDFCNIVVKYILENEKKYYSTEGILCKTHN